MDICTFAMAFSFLVYFKCSDFFFSFYSLSSNEQNEVEKPPIMIFRLINNAKRKLNIKRLVSKINTQKKLNDLLAFVLRLIKINRFEMQRKEEKKTQRNLYVHSNRRVRLHGLPIRVRLFLRMQLVDNCRYRSCRRHRVN